MFAPAIDMPQDTIRVSALHALAYCPRLFYLEEVEELYTQDAAVFAGRRLHAELEKNEDEEWDELFLESEELGLRGRVDALRTRDRQTIPYEHKRGKAARDDRKQPQAWVSDRLDNSKTTSFLFAPVSEPSTDPPESAWTWTPKVPSYT
jgi:CRISPR-associated protein Cas1